MTTAINARALEILQQQLGNLLVTLAQKEAELEAAKAEIVRLTTP